jgi:thermitase
MGSSNLGRMRGQALPRRIAQLPIVCALAVVAWLPTASFAQSPERIIVKRDPGLSAAQRADLRAGVGASLVDVLRLPQTEVVTVPAQDADHALAELNSDPDVVYAEPDRRRSAFVPPNDPLWPSMWGLANIGQAPFGGTPGDDIHLLDAWLFSLGAGQTVGVVDSGIDFGHADLAGQIAAGGRNFVPGSGPGDVRDLLGHGTHVSGTIAALANNTMGVVGVAPAAKVLPLRAIDNGGGAFDSWIAQAFDYAGDLGLRVVNASFGGVGGNPSQTVTGAIGAHPSTLYVVASGNEDLDARIVMPCNTPRPNVVCVGASDYDDRRASFSNYGATSVDLFAPGVDIMSTLPGGNYGFEDGSSMATPHVSGEAALLLASAPWLSSQELKDLILGTVDPRPWLAGLSVTGGRANAGAALRRLFESDGDGDGLSLLLDRCPTVPGTGADGCPVVAPPFQASGAGNALPRIRSLRVKVRPKRCRGSRRRCVRTATVVIRSDRAATAKVTIQRRRCGRRRCRWVVVARRSVAIARGKTTVRVRSRRLVRGRYRATVVLSNNVGAADPRRSRFRIR